MHLFKAIWIVLEKVGKKTGVGIEYMGLKMAFAGCESVKFGFSLKSYSSTAVAVLIHFRRKLPYYGEQNSFEEFLLC